MWPVGRDAGSLRGYKVRRVYKRHGLLGDFYTLLKTIRTWTDARAGRPFISALSVAFRSPRENPLDCLTSFGRLKPGIHANASKNWQH